MRPNNQNKRSRGRNNGGRKHSNPLSRNYESNGPDVKVRGNASHIAEKYLQLARDAQASGDSVMAENYLQHAEHYFRIISAAQAQNAQRQEQSGNDQNANSDDGDDDAAEAREDDAGQRNQRTRNRRDKDDDAKGADTETAQESESEADAEDKPRKTRRPRRRKQSEDAEAANDAGKQDAGSELPAFLTGTTAAE